MGSLRQVTAGAAAALVTVAAGCVSNHFSEAYVARTEMVGLSRDEVRMCAGFPEETDVADEREIWSYSKNVRAGAGMNVPVLPGLVGAQLSLSSGGDCSLQILFEEDRVRRIAYAGNNDSFAGRNAVCAPLVAECVDYARSRATP